MPGVVLRSSPKALPGASSSVLALRRETLFTMTNRLFYGDNLDVLRNHVADGSVDLVYLDPPFNSNRSYNVIFARNASSSDTAQIQAFDDTWRWTQVTEIQYLDLVNGGAPTAVGDALRAMHTLVGENDALAYLVNMAPRLVELHRVLKPTGSLWLHCDPTMSHYLKLLLDAIFGAANFRNEIIWQRTGSKGLMKKRLPTNHDVILSYQRSDESPWNIDAAFLPYDENNLPEKTAQKYSLRDPDGRRYELKDLTNPNPDRPNLTYEFLGVTKVWRWTKERMQEAYDQGLVVQTAPGRVPRVKRYLDEQRGLPLSDVWADIAPLNSQAAERLGYPTQKPVALLERILELATEPGDVVLDPFCGCGTTIDAAIRMDRQWVGIDITYIAVGLIQARLRDTYDSEIEKTYKVLGIPRDLPAAQALFKQSPFDFERWAVTLADGTPNQKQVGDRGIDGVIRFLNDAKGKRPPGRVLVSVKGGRTLNPGMVRDLVGTVESQKAEMGLLITMSKPTSGMVEAADHSGSYVWPINGQPFPKVQIITVGELLEFVRPKMPPAMTPYISAVRRPKAAADQLELGMEA